MSPRGQLARGIALAGVLAVALSAAPVTDGGRKAPPTLARPEALVAFTDPGFGTRVQRITGDPGTAIDGLAGQRWGAVVRHFYSKYSAWNADETLLILQNREPDDGGERLFLDGQTYRPRFSRVAPGDVRWDPLRPDWMAYLDGDEFGWWHVRDDRRERVARFPGYRRLSFGLGEGNLSWNGRWCVIVARNAAGRQVAFAFDARTQKKFPDLDLEDVRLDWASISPLGNYLVVDADAFTALEDNAQVYDREGRKVGALWAEYGRPSHYDLTVDENGDEVAVGVSKSRPDNGRVIKRRLRDGAITVLTAAGYASHTSTRNIRRPGWAFVTYQTNDARWAPYLNEVTAVSLDGSLRVERWAHLHTFPQGYLTEAHAVPSPDGRRVLWASNWDNPAGRPIGAYVADARALVAQDFVTDVAAVHVPAGGRATFRLRLAHRPAALVHVRVQRVSGDADLSVRTGACDFTPEDWDQWQRIEVAAADDAGPLNGAALLRCSAPGLAPHELFAVEEKSP